MLPRRLRCDPMLVLVFGLPAAAVLAGLASLVIALRAGDPELSTDRVQRIAQIQSTDLAPDRRAAMNGMSAMLQLDEHVCVVELDGLADPPRHLLARFEHPTQQALDRTLTLQRDGARWSAVIDLPNADHWRIILQPVDGSWRIEGQLRGRRGQAILRPRFVHG